MNNFDRLINSLHSYLRLPANCHTCVIPIGAQEGVHACNAQVCLHYVIEYRPGLTTRLWLGMKQTEEVGHRSIDNTTKSVCV